MLDRCKDSSNWIVVKSGIESYKVTWDYRSEVNIKVKRKYSFLDKKEGGKTKPPYEKYSKIKIKEDSLKFQQCWA